MGSATDLNTSLSPQFSDEPKAQDSTIARPGSVIKHLGRLVSVPPGQDFFAGSTTGVHFVRSVEQRWQYLSDSNEAFPDLFYRMHLLVQPTMLCPSMYSFFEKPWPSVSLIGEDLSLSEDYYISRVKKYLSRWNAVYPILCQKQSMETFEILLFKIKADSTTDSDVPDLYRLLLVLSIEAWDAQDLAHDQHALHYYKIATKLESSALEQINIGTVQSRLLKVLYLHLSGKHGLVACEVGSTVRAAQCIGLHRQSRRFKLCAGEAEYRTRLWWCVSIFDILTATAYGLPKLVSDVDVDVLLPTDCDFDDLHAIELSVPLPGERAQSATFIAFVKLHTILRQAAQALFTTTERRNGEAKIHRLERQLRVWRYENAHLTKPVDYSAHSLDLMSHFAMLLIHQPGLTMDENSQQIDRSMSTSVESAVSILQVLTTAKDERRLFYLQPNATRMAFQSALMCLYYTWHKGTTDIPSMDHSMLQVLSLDSAIEMACNLMNLHRRDLAATGTTSDPQEGNMARREIDQATIILRRMSRQTYVLLGQQDKAQSEPSSDLDRVIADDATMQYSNDDWLGQSSLWELNSASLQEWSEGLRLESIDQYLPSFCLD